MINLELGFAFEADGLAGAQESLDLLQAQFLCFVHVDGQSSACHPLQAHLVLESHLPFRLILYWIRLPLQLLVHLGYTPCTACNVWTQGAEPWPWSLGRKWKLSTSLCLCVRKNPSR